MRRTFGEQLQELDEGLAALARLAERAVADATRALLDGDVAAADDVFAAVGALRRLHEQLDALAMDLLARQQPVATDLRTVVASMQMAGHLTRVGDYAVHLARTARQRPLPELAVARVAEMGARASAITGKVADVIASRDVATAQSVLRDDDAVDRLHVELLESLLVEPQRLPAEQVVDVTLVGRYYERLADHAVAVAQSVAYVVTGAPPVREHVP